MFALPWIPERSILAASALLEVTFRRTHCNLLADNALLVWTTFASVSHMIEMRGGDDGTRTRDLCRDRAAF